MLTQEEFERLVIDIDCWSHEEEINFDESEGTYSGGDRVITLEVLFDILEDYKRKEN